MFIFRSKKRRKLTPRQQVLQRQFTISAQRFETLFLSVSRQAAKEGRCANIKGVPFRSSVSHWVETYKKKINLRTTRPFSHTPVCVCYVSRIILAKGYSVLVKVVCCYSSPGRMAGRFIYSSAILIRMLVVRSCFFWRESCVSICIAIFA